jgi:U3 small nucleolar ribonucleoprotein component
MAGITLKQADAHLQAWLKAELEITTSQSYKIGTRSLTRADLAQVREQVKFWQNKVNELQNAEKRGGRNRVYRAVPRDN